MRNLIVPVDSSPNAANAARYAVDMALAIDAEVHLLHVVAIPPTPMDAPVGFVLEAMEKDGAALLEALSNELRSRTMGQVTINTQLVTGGIDSSIAECTKRLRPFAVVMGAPEGSFVPAISGSPAVDSARRLPYPVLVVPAGAYFHRIRRIVLACEAAEVGGGIPVTLGFLKELKDLFAARFDIINVARPKDEKKEDEKVFEVYRWKEALEEVFPELHFLRAATVLEGIDNYLGDHDGDWLMLFPRKHGVFSFHRSQAKNLVMHCRVPVLSITEAAFQHQLEDAAAAKDEAAAAK